MLQLSMLDVFPLLGFSLYSYFLRMGCSIYFLCVSMVSHGSCFRFHSSCSSIDIVNYQLCIESLIFLFVHNSWCVLDFNVLYCMVVTLEVSLSPEMSFIVPWLWSLSSVTFCLYQHLDMLNGSGCLTQRRPSIQSQVLVIEVINDHDDMFPLFPCTHPSSLHKQ